MPNLSNTSLRARLILAFFSLVMMMSLSTYLAINFSSSASQEMRLMVEDQTRRALLAQRAAKRVQFATLQLLTLLQTDSREERIPLYQSMDEALRGADAAIRTLSKELSTPEIARFIEIRNIYGERFQATVEEIEFNGLIAARTHFAMNTQPILNQLLAEAEEVSIAQQDAMAEGEAKYQQQSQTLSSMMIVIEIIVVLLGLIFSYLFARGLAALMHDPVRLADQIASGDYTTQIPPARAPELKRLYNAMEHMRSGILGREQQIKRLAFEDRLTGLGSRLHFMQKLEQAVLQPSSCLVLFDVNRFTQINKALGHSLGDSVLVEIAERLQSFSPTDSSLSRLEANRFGILLSPGLSDTAVQLVEQILAGFEQPISLSEQKLQIDLRAAIVRIGVERETPEALLRSAEVALLRAKHQHANLLEASEVTPPDEEHSLTLLGELKSALSESQFKLLYQPKWCSAKKRITGVEALIRWIHPQRGFISPDLFIPFCEQTGFIRQVTPWVINEAAAAASRWQASGADLVVSINLSTLDLDNPALESHLQQALTRFNLPAEKLCLEVTESALMSDPTAGRACLERLRSMGFKLSIDDYGTGLASLAYVRDLPVQELKIDRSFITDLHREPRNAAIVRSTLQLCQELGISQVAEGVETQEELDWLVEQQCSLIQGYLISKPIDEKTLLTMLESARAH